MYKMKKFTAETSSKSKPSHINLRSFIRKSGLALAGISIIPRYVLGGQGYVAPSDKIATACVGVGSQGTRVMMDFLREPDIQVVSVCDVNTGSDDFIEWGRNEIRNKVRNLLEDNSWARLVNGPLAGLYPAQEIVQRYYANQKESASYKGCSAYIDYRELLEKEKNIDAVIVGTPDHLHAPVSIAAMKKGKHVFCQKPMVHTVYEAHMMGEVAHEMNVATQVATGNSASEDTRILCEWIWSGAIGQIRDVHNWTDRPYWPQGIERPIEEQSVPRHLNWDLWLGPSPNRPYNSVYQPFNWRGWYDFGTGSVGDT